ncbi:MAG: crotonase/enoyl-CoA hydratase family protein [Deltaproteobacteria bacterium]|uniref:Crotonase/enoyl-CoA hydratase family protein n=1 Tax=Candidatus Zymogenus saltonus TaxID=2844893 RepID=A0A9D8KHA9_9DELT|nr:crotonase/enoyl-CoA hydratase family protein [Candidatus Zymogenus saltonus]
MTKKYKVFDVERKGAIAWVFMNRPDKLNACGPDFWRESIEVMAELDDDDEIRVVILAGRGKCFTAGIDLIGMAPEVPGLSEKGIMGRKRLNMVKKILELQDSITAFEKCRKPVIAAVHGYCIGAGVDIITACDIRLASKDATFSVREARVAIVADAGTLQRLPRIVGEGHTKELTYTTRSISADRAKEINLVNEVYPDMDALFAGAQALAEEIAEQAPLAVMSAKEVIHYCRDKNVADGLDYVANRSANILPSEDFFEAITAFGERRKPKFPGT